MNIEVVPSTFKENLDPTSFASPIEYAKETARRKAVEVARRLGMAEKQSGDSVNSPPDIVIGADTIITVGDKIYGKPKDEEDAKRTLKELSGKPHIAITGFVLVTPGTWKVGHLLKESEDKPALCVMLAYETTEVFMCDLPPEIINAYLKTGEPMGRAGSYSIQDLAATFVESINGDYYNVVGLPLHKFCRQMLQVCMTKQQ